MHTRKSKFTLELGYHFLNFRETLCAAQNNFLLYFFVFLFKNKIFDFSMVF